MSCITLLSDFGLQDASVAAAKGILKQHLPGVPIIDISHDVVPYHLQQGAYLLVAAYKNFEPGTCHVLLIDIFCEKSPRLILCEYDGHYFIAPDNGILSIAFGTELEKVWQCFELGDTGIFKDWLHETGKVISRLYEGKLNELQLPASELKNTPRHCRPIINEHSAECQVIHIDRYRNVIINITHKQFEAARKGRHFRIEYMRNEVITEISTRYNSVREGIQLCRFNSSNYLEIAVNRGNAAELFGLRLEQEKDMIYNTIKIFFG